MSSATFSASFLEQNGPFRPTDMFVQQIDIEHSTIHLEDIAGMEHMFGEQATGDPAKGFKLEVDNEEPERLVLKFSRGDDRRDIMIEQQGDAIALYFYPNQPEMEEKILLKRSSIATGSETSNHLDGHLDTE